MEFLWPGRTVLASDIFKFSSLLNAALSFLDVNRPACLPFFLPILRREETLVCKLKAFDPLTNTGPLSEVAQFYVENVRSKRKTKKNILGHEVKYPKKEKLRDSKKLIIFICEELNFSPKMSKDSKIVLKLKASLLR